MATLNAGSGADGNATASSNTNLSTTSLVGRTYGDMVGYSCNAVTSNSATVVETPNGIDVGDEVLLMNLRGPGYGTESEHTEGNYETFTVEEINSNTITFNGTKSKFYGDMTDFFTGGTAYSHSDGYGADTNAFDKSTSTIWQSDNDSDPVKWIAYKTPTAKRAIKMGVHPMSNGNQWYLGPTNAKLQGSNDSTNGSDGTWTDILTGWNANGAATWYYFDLDNENSYTWYRIWSQDTFGAGNSMGFAEWTLWEGTDTNIGNGNQNDNNVILMRVPNYENLTVNNSVSLTCNNFNIHYVPWRYGITEATTPIGGIIFLRISDTFTLNGTVSTASLGPRGGNVDNGGGYGSWANQNGGIGHPPPVYGSNPGKGGSHGTLGNSGNTTYGEQTLLTKMHMGSGGQNVRSGGTGPTAGGGIVAIFATQADIVGTLDAKTNDNTGGDWAGGAGSGGSILLQAATLNMTSPAMDATGGTNAAAFSTSTGGDGRVAIYYNTLNGTITNVNPTPYTEDDLELPYYISGTISHDGEVRVYNTDWTFVRAESHSAGAYTMTNLPSSGPFIIVAEADNAQYNIVGYKSVTSVYN